MSIIITIIDELDRMNFNTKSGHGAGNEELKKKMNICVNKAAAGKEWTSFISCFYFSHSKPSMSLT